LVGKGIPNFPTPAGKATGLPAGKAGSARKGRRVRGMRIGDEAVR
jgi:hypothetical protein